MNAKEREARIRRLEEDVKKMQEENKRLFGYTKADRKKARKKKIKKFFKKLFFTDLSSKRRKW